MGRAAGPKSGESGKTPYSNRQKKQITINLNEETIHYFKKLSEEVGIPYQTLMNLYLTECAEEKKRLHLHFS